MIVMRWWRRQSLLVQLVLIVVVLGAAALGLAGAAATASLREYLIGQIDTQLQQASRAPLGPERPGYGGTAGARQTAATADDDDDEPAPRGLPAEFYVQFASSSTGAVTVLSRPRESGAPELPAMTIAEAAERSGEPFTVPGSDGSGSWRAVVQPANGGVITWAKPLADVDSTVTRLTVLELVIGAGVLAALAAIATVAIRRNLRPLVEVEHTATAIAAGDLSRRVPPGEPTTEVGQLSAAVNTMLDSISENIDARDAALTAAQASEARMRQFVADASHELRTPLTSIRGYAELYRQGAIPAPDVPATFARMEGEAERMAGLVNDLLLLARLDQQRPLERAQVDLLALANDVLHSARAAYPDRELRLAAAGDGVPVVTGDQARLRQVLTNLVMNAVKYTDGPVRITVASAPTWVGVAVADQGPGIPDADKERVFERFYRGEASRTRAKGGSGLGLSIVAAIVKAHHGTVSVRDNDGGGAVFEVRLPAAG